MINKQKTFKEKKKSTKKSIGIKKNNKFFKYI